MSKAAFTTLALITLLAAASVIPAYSAGPPDIQKKVFIHYANPAKGGEPGPPPGKGGGGEEKGFYKLISGGIRWQSFPVPLEVNPSLSSLDVTGVLQAIGVSAEEWDDGAYSGWGGVTPNLFDNNILTTSKGYNDLAWTSSQLDGANTLIWGNYPTEGVIAVTILWYNVKTKAIIEFDLVFDTDFQWSLTGEEGKMDIQNIATHELGHGAGLDDIYQEKANQETMYGYSTLGDIIKRDLYTGDKEGITKLYG
ncbi:MAG: matrixin family metalloprotease [Candidatus Bathyarchaeia archaeon]